MRDSTPLTLRDLVRRLARHWVWMVGVGAAVLLGVVAFTFLVTPRYESTAVLRIMRDDPTQALGQSLSDLPGASMLGLDRDDLDTEVGVLRSWTIAEAVVDSLSLMVRLEEPAGVRHRVFEVGAHGDPERYGDLVLDATTGDAFRATFHEEDGPESSLGEVRAGEPFQVAGYTLRLSPTPPEDGWPDRIEIELLTRYEAVEELREELEIRQQEGGSRLVEIEYLAQDRFLAAAVVNTLVEEYVAYKTRAEAGDARFTVAELREELDDESQALARAEERLRSYQEEARIVAPEEEAVQQVQRIAQLQLKADALEVEREALKDLLAVIEERTSTDPAPAPTGQEYRRLATFPSLISNGAIQELLVVLMELENERAQLLGRRTAENTEVRQLTGRIEELERQLYRLGSDYLQGLETQLASTDASLGRLEDVLEAMPDRELGYLRRYRDVEVLNESYLLLQQQLRMAEIQEAVRSEGVRVIDRGLVAHEDDPEFPRPAVNLFLGLVLALALGLAAGLIRELWIDEPPGETSRPPEGAGDLSPA